jgi:RNA polymerase sigma factor (sigma-70 family)
MLLAAPDQAVECARVDVEASTLQAPAVRARRGVSISASLLRLRSDEQLVALFRAGHDEAFRAIHDRYRQRLFAYTRQMLPGRQDAEDALQDVFVRAYTGLRANHRHVALRAWLYRVAHNRCVDELRRPLFPPAEVFDLIAVPHQDPVAQAEQRESLRRLIGDLRRLPDQQRSALLMRELSGMSYAELAEALDTTVPAVKSLLVRARIALARALEARDTACADIREELVLAQDRRVRPNAMARRHMRDCAGCREFRHELRGISRELAAFVPALGPLGILAKLLGFGFGGGAGGGAAVGGGGAATGGATMGAGGAVGTGGAVASAGMLATGAGHVASLIVATVVTAGGAVEIQHTLAPAPAHPAPPQYAAPARHAPNAQAPAASQVAGDYYVAPISHHGSGYLTAYAAPDPVAPAPPSAAPAAAAKAKPAGAVVRVTKTSHGADAGSSQSSTPGLSDAGGSNSVSSTGTDPALADGSTGTGSPASGSGASTAAGAGTAQTAGGGSGAGSGSTSTGAPGGASGSGSTSAGGSPSGEGGGAGPTTSAQ